MATIYTHIAENNRKTVFLMTFFLVFTIAFGWLISWWFREPLILYIVIIIALIQSFISFWWSDKTILYFSQAKPIRKKDNPELYNIVENLCITAGLPMPKIYIIHQNQPNAFATGRDKNHASIAITTGLLKKLEKPELEGVIAHELSHIGNRDILLQSVVVVLVSVIALLSQFFLRLSFFTPARSDRDSGGNLFFLIFGIAAIILAPLAATLLHLAISRKREFLADASAALLTRYPEGLARALEKISADPSPLPVANPSTAHLYIVNPLHGKSTNNWISNLFSTHPPIKERIRRLRAM